MNLNKDAVDAVKQGDLKRLLSSTDRNAVLQGQTPDGLYQGFTALHYSAHHGQAGIARWLIDNGADLNAGSRFYGSPLCVAAAAEKLDLVELLVRAGADIHRVLQCELRISDAEGGRCELEGRTLLYWAIARNHLELVRLLLQVGANPNHKGGILEQSPLHYAASIGRSEAIEALLDAGADLEKRYLFRKQTALAIAAAEGRSEAARVLLQRGACLTVLDEDGRSLLHLAAAGGIGWLVEHLLAAGLAVNGKDAFGVEPLNAALFEHHEEAARALILGGADIHHRNGLGQTPLVNAAFFSTSLVQMLIERGAEVMVCGKNGESPLHRAALAGRVDIVRMLLEKSDLVNARAEDGRTPLYLAAEASQVPMVELLLEAGADPNLRTSYGRSPLHVAAEKGSSQIVKLLLEAGAAPNARLPKGATPLYVAADLGQTEVVSLLLEAGADATLTSRETGDELTPLEVAVEKFRFRVVRVLKAACPTQDQACSGDEDLLSRLVPGLAEVVRLLRPTSEVADLDRAASLLERNRDLLCGVTSKELLRLRRSRTPSTLRIAEEIGARRRQEVHTAYRCTCCGRDTLVVDGSAVLHGNPSTPASDTEVSWDLRCASCGWAGSR